MITKGFVYLKSSTKVTNYSKGGMMFIVIQPTVTKCCRGITISAIHIILDIYQKILFHIQNFI